MFACTERNPDAGCLNQGYQLATAALQVRVHNPELAPGFARRDVGVGLVGEARICEPQSNGYPECVLYNVESGRVSGQVFQMKAWMLSGFCCPIL